MSTQNNKALAVALGGAFAVTLAAAPVVHAAENPFAMKTLSGGYMVAEADKAMDGEKMKDGKCGTGKCGANKKKAAEEEKAKEGKCSGDKKSTEGKCSGNKH